MLQILILQSMGHHCRDQGLFQIRDNEQIDGRFTKAYYLLLHGMGEHRCYLGVELLKSGSEGSETTLKTLWHHTDAIMCCSLKVEFIPKFSVRAIWQRWRESYLKDGTKADDAIIVFTGIFAR
ncbi:homeobox-leucine zipper protein HOX10-like isoform X2 [Camellia sinensis]|uniref:homeobox-leucine zipper protein HOX10-like isoform X2 n=1 Tax=Camellia sinensis TaxID=4442 RepID=UPI001036A603|nr:homeobox-leucine zipper protein HOX10-like isoform X2 [Camellia sinensis]